MGDQSNEIIEPGQDQGREAGGGSESGQAPPGPEAGAPGHEGFDAPPGAEPSRVPLSELLRSRQRAQEAEARAAEMGLKLQELQGLLAQTREALDAVERTHRIDLALIEAQAIDLESARLLTELAVSQMDEPDVAAAVAELARRKPFLFRARPARHSAATSAHAMSPPGAALLEAQEAARAGDRRALLRYLEQRRAER